MAVSAAGSLALCIQLLAAAPAHAALPSVPDGNELKFRVYMSGQEIGRKTMRFAREDDRLTVDTHIDFRVRFAFITVYRYEHRNREVWRDGRLESLDTTTNDDGEKIEIRARPQGNGLLVTGGRETVTVPRDAVPSNYWNKWLLKARVGINNQLGEALALESHPFGNDTVIAHGEPVTAERHKLLGWELRNGQRAPQPYIDIDLWYDAQDTLVHMAFKYRGFEFVYVLE